MKTVLVVDDELAIADMLRATLEEEGYHVMIGANGREALDLLATDGADLVISDLMMPGLDGQSLYRALKADPRHAAMPIVLMSAVGDALLEKGLAHDGFLTKPFHIDEALRLVERLIGKAVSS
jgi:two-component system chemotaxis response regulator CheY